MVDWSANNGPKTGTNSIWVADGDASGALSSRNYATRCQAHSAVLLAIDRSLAGGERALVGYDFSLGYPAGFGAYFSGPARPWERIWEHMEANVSDTDTNMSNRFEVANDINAATAVAFYWGSPVPWPALAPRLREPPPGLLANPLATYRRTELMASAQVRRAIKSGWQLGNGVSVGSQVITGLPYLQRLRRRYRRALAVWPHETGFVDDPLGPGLGSRWYWRKSGPRRSCRPTRGASGTRNKCAGRSGAVCSSSGPRRGCGFGSTPPWSARCRQIPSHRSLTRKDGSSAFAKRPPKGCWRARSHSSLL